MTLKDQSNYYIDANVVKIITLQVVLVTSLSIGQGWALPIFLLSVDFLLRAVSNQPVPTVAIANLIIGTLRLQPKPILAAPRKFATGLDFLIALTTFILSLLHIYPAAYVAGAVLLLSALSELVFKGRIGSYLYHQINTSTFIKRTHKIQKKQQEND